MLTPIRTKEMGLYGPHLQTLLTLLQLGIMQRTHKNGAPVCRDNAALCYPLDI